MAQGWRPEWGNDPDGRVEALLCEAATEWLRWNQPPTSYCMDEALFVHAAESLFWRLLPALATSSFSSDEIRRLCGGVLPVDGQPLVYRHFADDDLLYVGFSEHFTKRQRGHRSSSPWWNWITRISIESHPTAADALRAEARAITDEDPYFNIAGRTNAVAPR